jgi:hypothetical protein
MNVHHKKLLYDCVVVMTVAASLIVSGCGRKDVSTEVTPRAQWFDDMRERIQGGFDDPAQVAALTNAVNQMESAMVEIDRDAVEYYATIKTLDREYGTTREQFQEVIDGFNERQYAVFEQLLVHMAEMKRIAGREGWMTLVDIDKTLYELWQMEMQP